MSAKRMRTIAVGGIIFIAIVIAIGFVYSGSSKNMTDLIRKTSSMSGGQNQTDQSGQKTDNLPRVEVTPQTVQAIIASFSRPISYSRTIEVSNYSSGGAMTYSINAYILNGNTRLEIADEGSVKYVMIAEKKVYIWYKGNSKYYETNLGASTDDTAEADEWQMLPTYEDVMKLDKSAISEAGYVTYDGYDCIFVNATTGSLHYSTKYYISVELGLLISAETYDGDKLIYKMTAKNFNSAVPDSGLFMLPDGRNVIAIL